MILKARITSIIKDDMKYCSSRCIWASLIDEHGIKYHVAWAKTPDRIDIIDTSWRSMSQRVFDKAWNQTKVGDFVWLYYIEDESNFGFFEPVINRF